MGCVIADDAEFSVLTGTFDLRVIIFPSGLRNNNRQ